MIKVGIELLGQLKMAEMVENGQNCGKMAKMVEKWPKLWKNGQNDGKMVKMMEKWPVILAKAELTCFVCSAPQVSLSSDLASKM